MRTETIKSELRSILKVWFSIFKGLDVSALENEEIWKDWRNPNYKNEPNAILESEMILTFLLPQDALPDWHLQPNKKHLPEELGNFLLQVTEYESYTEQIDLILDILIAHFKRLQRNGKQVFSTPDYLDAESDLRSASMVDAFSLGITVSLISKRLANRIIEDRVVRQGADPNKTTKRAIELKGLADERLTDALVGMLSSFAVNAISWDTWHKSGKSADSRWSWPGKENTDNPVDSNSARSLSKVKHKLQTLGFKIADEEAFECGWSWGPVFRRQEEWDSLFGGHTEDPEKGESLWSAIPKFAQDQDKLAENAPYLYFTTIALDGIEDLLAPENYSTGLLNSKQIVYASRLQALESAARQYWAALAMAPAKDGYHKNLIELVPWKTADNQASVYWNIFVLRICSDILIEGGISIDRQFNLLERLAESGLLLREPIPEDADTALKLHWPGLVIDLVHHDTNDTAAATPASSQSNNQWLVYDYTPQLLKLAVRSSSRETNYKRTLDWSKLLNVIWKSLEKRKDHITPVGSSWDRIDKIFPKYVKALIDQNEIGEIAGVRSLPWPDGDFQQGARSGEKLTVTSWYFTERIVESIVLFLSRQETRRDEFPHLEKTVTEMLVGLRHALPDETIETLERKVEEAPAEAFKLIFQIIGRA